MVKNPSLAVASDYPDFSTQQPLPALPSRQAVGWIKGNLFGSALDSILTAFVLAELVLVANPFFTWVTQTAEWPVTRANLVLMAKDRNPIESIWCIWIVVGMYSLQSITNGQYEAT